jgi:L-ornithine N5-oxygenase
MMNASRVAEVDESGDTLKVSVQSLPTGEIEILDTDVLVYATGYRPGDAVRLLGRAGDLVERRPDGAPTVHRDYRLGLQAPSLASVYVQGGTEHSHGISSSLLSNVAIRTGEIVESVAGRRTATAAVEAPPVPVATGFAG